MSDEEQYEPLYHVANILEKVAADYRTLRAENEKLRAAGEKVVKWWLDEGCLPFDGAPYALFALREALDGERAAAKALN